jgi:hypothetical protein
MLLLLSLLLSPLLLRLLLLLLSGLLPNAEVALLVDWNLFL